MVNKNRLSNLAQGTFVDGWLLLQQTTVKTSANNNPYLSLKGRDSNGVLCTCTYYKDVATRYPPGTVLRIVGDAGDPTKYQNTVYAKDVTQITDPADIKEFKAIGIPKVPQETLAKVMTDLEGYAHCFQEPGILQLSKALWSYFKPCAMTRPAGVLKHEPMVGGLALHTWQVVTLLNSALFIPRLDRDVLWFSALYHDIGKSQEYTEDIQFTPTGRLFGHIPLGLELIQKYLMETGAIIPDVQLKHIKHCILTHHGKDAGYDRPATREANAVHHADLMMANQGFFDERIRCGDIGEDGWGRYDDNLKTTVFVPQLIKATNG